VKPDAYSQLGKIVQEVFKVDFKISRMKMVKLTPEDIAVLFPGAGMAEVSFLTSDVCVAMEIYGDNAISIWRAKLGEVNSQDATCLRRIFGTDSVRDGLHASMSVDKARDELEMFFGRSWPTTAVFNNCTCAVIRPHAMLHAGEMIDAILSEGFEISALEMFTLKHGDAEEFLDVYKGVVPTWHDEVKQLVAGQCIAMEIRQEDAVNSLRQLVGPHDPEVARHLRPHTLRGKFGEDRVKNAIHCTDLAEDGLIESEYFFQLQPTR
jgi:nucleoside-diphosphate kinase